MLSIERDGAVATLWLDRPEKLNAMGPEFWDELPVAMTALGSDTEVRAVVIAGRGRAFSVGLDLSTFGTELAGGVLGGGGGSEAAKRQALLDRIKSMQRSITSVAECPKPVIAAVQGYCLGGAVDLITACDIRLATTDAVFSIRETRLAMVADVGTLQRLPGIVGSSHVADWAFTGRDVTAAEALAAGLVSKVFGSADALWAGAEALAAEIASNSPLAVQGTKAVLRATRGRSVAEALDYVAVWNAAFLESPDLTEAISAFMEKRPPRFGGI